jgi:hypothetical protein
MITFEVGILLKNKTTEQWAADKDVQRKGCACVEWADDGKTKLKVGDGVSTFADLPYIGGEDITLDNILSALGYTPADSSKIGVANGIASLDDGGKVPADQLPSFVDDVIEIADISAAPETGEVGKIYVAIDTGKCYRWSGTMYVEISTSDVVTASDNNGYIKVNGTDVKVYNHSQSDWNETDETAEGYIKNKPVIPEGVVVDTELSDTSDNAIANKVVKAALDGKLNLTDKLILNCTL